MRSAVWRNTPNTRRTRKAYKLTLPDDVWEALGELAGAGGSRSAVVEDFDALPVTVRARVAAVFVRLQDWPRVSGAKPLRGEWAGH